MIGQRFDETGELPLEEWYALFEIVSEDGSPLPLDARPLVIALHKQQAAHRAFSVRTRDGRQMKVEATAFPLQGQGGRTLGVVSIFWEAQPT